MRHPKVGVTEFVEELTWFSNLIGEDAYNHSGFLRAWARVAEFSREALKRPEEVHLLASCLEFDSFIGDARDMSAEAAACQQLHRQQGGVAYNTSIIPVVFRRNYILTYSLLLLQSKNGAINAVFLDPLCPKVGDPSVPYHINAWLQRCNLSPKSITISDSTTVCTENGAIETFNRTIQIITNGARKLLTNSARELLPTTASSALWCCIIASVVSPDMNNHIDLYKRVQNAHKMIQNIGDTDRAMLMLRFIATVRAAVPPSTWGDLVATGARPPRDETEAFRRSIWSIVQNFERARLAFEPVNPAMTVDVDMLQTLKPRSLGNLIAREELTKGRNFQELVTVSDNKTVATVSHDVVLYHCSPAESIGNTAGPVWLLPENIKSMVPIHAYNHMLTGEQHVHVYRTTRPLRLQLVYTDFSPDKLEQTIQYNGGAHHQIAGHGSDLARTFCSRGNRGFDGWFMVSTTHAPERPPFVQIMMCSDALHEKTKKEGFINSSVMKQLTWVDTVS